MTTAHTHMAGRKAPAAERPRLRAGMAVSADQEKITFVGTARSKEVRGADALAVLLPVVRLLDGSRDVDQVAAETGLQGSTVAEACAFLRVNGLLDEGAPHPENAPMRTFLASYLEISPQDAVIDSHLALLGGARVSVLAPPELATRIVGDLRACGLGQVRAMEANTARQFAADGTGGPRLVLLDRSLHGSEETDRLVEDLRSLGTAVLTFFLGSEAFELGPTFAAEPGVCHHCYRRSFAARFGDVRDSGPVEAVHHRVDLSAGLLCQEVLALLGGFVEPSTRNAMVRFGLPTLTRARYLVGAEPDCPNCPVGWVASVEAFENYAQLRHPARPVPVSDERRRATFVAGLPDSRPAYPYHPRRPLPELDARDREQPPGDLSPGTVARLLRMTAGRRDTGDRARWVASGGNLGSVELFAVSDGEFMDCPAGTVLRYDDITHELIVVSTRRARLLEAPGASTPTGSLQLVLVANMGRLAAKYGEFGLRLAYLDAGCALTQLHRVAELLGLAAETRTGWAPGLAGELELLDGAELITACVALSVTRASQEA